MFVSQALKWAIRYLGKRKIQNNYLDSEVLLSFVLGRPKEFLFSHPERKITKKQQTRYKQLVNRRGRGEPVAYLTGHKEFYGLDFAVNKNVLIPRPETEMLVEEVLKNKNVKTVADVGTGSGCVAVALVKNNPQLKIYAVDISAGALSTARKNARRHGVAKRIVFKRGDLLKPLQKTAFDAVVANLPYGWKQWKNNTSTETAGLKFEPEIALFTCKKGLQLYEKLLRQIKQLGKSMMAFLEFDPRQTAMLTDLIHKIFPRAKVKIKKDLSGRERVIVFEI